MFYKTLLCIATVAFASLTQAAPPARWMSWMDQYYLNPQPDQVVDAASALGDSFADPAFTATAIGFFSQVFARHPDRVDGWFRQFARLPESAQRSLAAALWYSGDARGEKMLRRTAERSLYRGEIHQLATRPAVAVAETPVRSESSMDLQWGAFLASGQDAHITQILAAMGHGAVDAEARRSLAFNASRHDRVLTIFREQLDRQPNEVQSMLRAVLRDAEQQHRKSS